MLIRDTVEAVRLGAILQIITDPYDHWKMDEAASATTAVNDGSHDYDLDNIEGSADFVSGFINNAIEFTGANGDRCYATADWSLGANSFTFGCFCKADDFGTADGRVMTQTSAVSTNAHDWMISTNTTARARARCRVDGTVVEIQSDNNVLVAGTWHHIVVTYDAVAGDLKLYVDKVIKASDLTLSGNFGGTATKDVGIGNNPGTISNRVFDGLIDDCRTYDRALAQADVDAWYDLGFGGADLQELDDAIPVGDVDTENPTTVEDAAIPVGDVDTENVFPPALTDAIPAGDVLATKPITVEDASVPVGDVLTTPLVTLALSDDIPAGDDLTTPLVVAPESDDIPVGDVDTENVFPPALTDNIPVGDDLTTLPLFVKTLDDAIPVGDVDTENPTTVEDAAIPVGDVDTENPTTVESADIPVGDDLTTLPLFVETIDDAIPVGDDLTTPLVIAPESDDIPVGDVDTENPTIVLSDDIPVGDDLTATPTGDVVSESDAIPVGDVLTTPLIILTLEDSAPVGDLDTENPTTILDDAVPVGDALNPFVPVTTPQGVIILRLGRDLEAPVKLTSS